MASKVRVLILCAVGVLAVLAAFSAQAATTSDLTFTPGCTGFVSRGGVLTPDRDNTGNRREAFVTTVTDGNGRVIYENTSFFPLGERFTFDDGTRTPYASTPEFNPIVLQIVSIGGNGADEQLVYLTTGSCAGLPTFGQGVFLIGDDLTLFPLYSDYVFAAADGRVGGVLDPNAAPPRPVNPVALVEAQPGYAIVNTDNLFMRTGDDARFAPVGILDGGTYLIVLGSNGEFDNEDALWWYVEVGGLRGWVKSEFLILRGDLTNLPIVPVLGTPTPPALYVGVNNPIYNTPSIGGRVLCEVRGNVLYPVVAQDAETAGWYRIQATCGGAPVEGWIQADRGLLRNTGGVEVPIVGF